MKNAVTGSAITYNTSNDVTTGNKKKALPEVALQIKSLVTITTGNDFPFSR